MLLFHLPRQILPTFLLHPYSLPRTGSNCLQPGLFVDSQCCETQIRMHHVWRCTRGFAKAADHVLSFAARRYCRSAWLSIEVFLLENGKCAGVPEAVACIRHLTEAAVEAC